MATLGSLNVSFTADLNQLRSALEESVSLINSLTDSVSSLNTELGKMQANGSTAFDSFVESLEETTTGVDGLRDDVTALADDIKDAGGQTIDVAAGDSVEVSVDTSQISEASASVEDFVDDIENSASRVEAATERFGRAFAEAMAFAADGTIAAESGFSSLVDSAKQAKDAAGQVKAGFESSFEGAKTASQKAIDAINAGNFDELVVAVGQATESASVLRLSFEAVAGRGLFALRGALTDIATQLGGTSTALAALGGNTNAMNTVALALGKSFVGLTTNLAVYTALVSAVDIATQDMSEESRGYLLLVTRLVAVQAAYSAGNQVAALSFASLAAKVAVAGQATVSFTQAAASARGLIGGMAGNAAGLASDLKDVGFAFSLITAAADKDTTPLKIGKIIVKSAAMGAALGLAKGAIDAFTAGTSILSGAIGGASVAFRSFVANFSNIAAFAVASALISGLGQELRKMSREIEVVQQLSFQFGMATDQVQLLSAAAKSAGLSMNALNRSQQEFAQNVSKIKFGALDLPETRDAAAGFDRLGISVQDLRKLSPEETFALTAKRLLEVEDAADRTGIAVDIFGNRFGNLLPALQSIEALNKEVNRLNLTSSSFEIGALGELEGSFDRVDLAAQRFAQSGASVFASLQRGINEATASILGGASNAFSTLSRAVNDFLQPLGSTIAILGRVAGLFIRLGAAIAALALPIATSFANLAEFIKVLEVGINAVLAKIEAFAAAIEGAAATAYNIFSPAIETASNTMENFSENIALVTMRLGAAIAVAGAVTASYQGLIAAGVPLGGLFVRIGKAALTGLGQIVPFILRNLLPAFKLLTKGILTTAIKASTAFFRIAASALFAGGQVVGAFVGQAIAALATYTLGIGSAAAASMVAGITMGTAFVIATGGLILVVSAIAGVIANWDKLTAAFANFDISDLFSFEGLGNIIGGAFDIIKSGFKSIVNGVGSIIEGGITAYKKAVSGVEFPEPINAATAGDDEILEARQRALQAQYDMEKKLITEVNTIKAGFIVPIFDMTPIPPPPDEDYEALRKSLAESESEMQRLSFEAAQFGDGASKGVLEAQEKFNELKQELSEGKISPEEYEESAREIRERIESQIGNLEQITDGEIQEFYQGLQKDIQGASDALRDLTSGEVVVDEFGVEQFFPTSQAIKDQAAIVRANYEAELEEIGKMAAEGQFGEGESGREAMRAAQEGARKKFDTKTSSLGRDMSFANDIRKNLENAFLSPLQKFEKRLSQIRNNRSLTQEEKVQAERNLRREQAESTFGRSPADEMRDRREMLQFLPEDRQGVEGRRLDQEFREGLGIETSASDQLQLGVDNIQEQFGVAGLSMREAMAEMSPEEFSQYREALDENRKAVLENLGIEQTGAEKIQESRERLSEALADGVISQGQYDKAVADQRRALLSDLGIDESPSEAYERLTDQIRENASELSSSEFAEAMENAKEDLLSAFGIDASPTQQFEDQIGDLREALRDGTISQEEYAEGARKSKESLMQALDIPVSPVSALQERLKDLQEALDEGVISQEEFALGSEEAKRSMLPGGEEESPVAVFSRNLEQLDEAVEQGLITPEEAQARKQRLQAQLQEDISPALDQLKADRREVGASDARSKGGVDTFFRILRGRDNPSLKAQQETARNTKLLAEAANNPDAAPVIVQLSS